MNYFLSTNAQIDYKSLSLDLCELKKTGNADDYESVVKLQNILYDRQVLEYLKDDTYFQKFQRFQYNLTRANAINCPEQFENKYHIKELSLLDNVQLFSNKDIERIDALQQLLKSQSSIQTFIIAVNDYVPFSNDRSFAQNILDNNKDASFKHHLLIVINRGSLELNIFPNQANFNNSNKINFDEAADNLIMPSFRHRHYAEGIEKFLQYLHHLNK